MKDQRSLSLELTAQQGRHKMGRNTCHTGYEGLTVQYEGAETRGERASRQGGLFQKASWRRGPWS